MWTKFLRRAAFVLFLLLAFASFAFSHQIAQSIARQSPGDLAATPAKAVAYASWGWGHSVCPVVALWFAGRKDWWRNGCGWGRAVLYAAAFVYGSMLFYPLQSWLEDAKFQDWGIEIAAGATPFHWPGLRRDDYAMPAMIGVGMLFQIWLLIPIFQVTRCALVEHGQSFIASPTFSIAKIMGWTVLAIATVSLMKFLTWKGVAPDTYFGSLTVEQCVREFAVSHAPMYAISAWTALLVVWSWSGKWWLPLLVLCAVLPLNNYAHECVFRSLESFGFSFPGHVLCSGALERWSYLAGEVLMVWTTFGVARFLGVQLKRGELAQPMVETTR